MNIAQMRLYDVANGSGIRATLFVSGCKHKCPSCFNQEYQDFDYGQEWNQELEDKFLSFVANDNITGVSFLGGEPFHPKNVKDLARLASKIKLLHPNKPIWVWTGYTYEEILNGASSARQLTLMPFIDVLIDGRFIESEKDLTLAYRGSRNQRVIDVKKTFNMSECEYDKVHLYDLGDLK